MPQMGVSVSEGTVTKWLKQVGEAIGRDEPLLEISTDKVDTEVPSPAEGIVTEILVQEGQTVEVGTVLALIGAAGAAGAQAEPAPAEPAPAVAAVPAPSGNGRTFVSPVVARIAAEHGVDPAAVPGTGTGGRVTKKDILSFIESGATIAQPAAAAAAPPPEPAVAAARAAPVQSAPVEPPAPPAPEAAPP